MRTLPLVPLVLFAGCLTRQDDRPAPPPPVGEATVFPDLSGPLLLDALLTEYRPGRTLGYGPARDSLFTYEMQTDGALEGLYTGYTVTLPAGLDPSAAADDLGVNTEHVWPQSRGAGDEPLRSDLHHLFGVRQNVNSSRQNLPFGEVPDDQTDAWYRLAQSQSNKPDGDVDAWSERGAGRFEPRESREGDVARAVFYAYALYRDAVDDDGGTSFFETMRDDLLRWNRLDPPDAEERARSAWIAGLQGTENPFVLDPTLADRAFGGGRPSTPPAPPTPAADLSVVEIHYDNAGADTGEGVEIAGPEGAPLGGWTLAFYNGPDGGVYETVSLSGRLGAGGVRWVPVEGIQNGSPDGLALVAPGGAVRQFLSYEGAFEAASGPAAGRQSQDVGVEETASTPAGQSLQLVGGRWALGPATPGRPN
jgi:hypothetical protein